MVKGGHLTIGGVTLEGAVFGIAPSFLQRDADIELLITTKGWNSDYGLS